MKATIALEKLIKMLEQHIAVSKGQLARHNSGEEKLTLLVESSVENSLEKNVPLLKRYKSLMTKFQKYDKIESNENERLRTAIDRKKFFKYNRKITEDTKLKENDEKIEAVMVIDELPDEIIIEDRELFEMVFKSMEQYVNLHDEAESELNRIKVEFDKLIKDFTDENIKSLELLNYLIPIVVFQFKLLKLNIIDSVNSESVEQIRDINCYPKYHDWWISDLWLQHRAYFALYQWKDNVAKFCVTEEQMEAWEIVFNNWIFVKTLLTEKNELAFELHYVFDYLLARHVDFESELDTRLVKKASDEIRNFIKNEDLFALMPDHHVVTPYIKYKTKNK